MHKNQSLFNQFINESYEYEILVYLTYEGSDYFDTKMALSVQVYLFHFFRVLKCYWYFFKIGKCSKTRFFQTCKVMRSVITLEYSPKGISEGNPEKALKGHPYLSYKIRFHYKYEKYACILYQAQLYRFYCTSHVNCKSYPFISSSLYPDISTLGSLNLHTVSGWLSRS